MTTEQKKVKVDIEGLIGQMTIEEKVGQMTQINLDLISKGEVYNLQQPHELDIDKLKTAVLKYHVGSFLNVPGYALGLDHWLDVISDIQKVCVEESRLKIPMLYGIDSIHGANYLQEGVLFPQPIAQAASWNPELVRKGAEITAYETRASGIPWAFSPVLDVMRQPLWIRSFETFGEDPYLCEVMGLAMVEGLEGDNVSDPYKVASCLKHFVGYSWPEVGKDRTPAYFSEIQLREYMMPPFVAAIEKGAKTIMINSGEINGIPTHANKELLQGILRDELGFEGVIVSDWEDIIKLHQFHRTSPTMKHAVQAAIEAGLDMSMVPHDYEFSELLVELVKEGTISESRIDESVRRILKLKEELGLFEHPVRPPSDYSKLSSAEHESFSYQTAAESITLLKNKSEILPLSAEQNVLLTGPMANSLSMVNGAWSRTWQGTEEERNNLEKPTVLDALKEKHNKVTYLKGCGMTELELEDGWEEKVSSSDIIIACMGELPATEKPGDIDDLTLELAQLEYVELLAKFNKPIVLVLFEARPRIINRIEKLCDAVIQAYYPSEEGTPALADILIGKVNPSGKLPYTYPKFVNNLLCYDYKITEGIDDAYGMGAFNPQFEFGTGLSYTNYEYSDFELLNGESASKNDDLKFKVKIKNIGSRDGKEVVMLFIADRYASITPSVKRLRDFKKLFIKAGETRTVEFEVPAERLSFVGRDNKWILEEGDFEALCGDQKISFQILEG